MLLQKHTYSGKISLLLAIILIVLSCTKFYKPVPYKGRTAVDSANFISKSSPIKYFILHKGKTRYAFTNITVDTQNLRITGKLLPVDTTHLLYVKAKGVHYHYKNRTSNVLNEIHVYVNNSATLDTVNPMVLPLSQIDKIEVIEKDKGRTTASYVLGGLGIVVGFFVVVTAIVFATSCPYVSAYDGDQFQLQGELFGGAVNPKLERSDYLPLKAPLVKNEYRIRISNELKEKQHTNFADLWVVEHPANVRVLPGPGGELYQLSDPQPPTAARMNDHEDVLNSVIKQDEIFTSFTDTTHRSGVNELNLTFDRKLGTTTGKLILRLKNSYWLDYLYGEFLRHFGNRYPTWIAKQQERTVEDMNLWTEQQNIPLTVSIKSKNEWREIQKLKTVGPLANRDVVIPFELEGNSNEPFTIKLSTGFLFWDLDYAAVDFSKDQPVSVTCLKPFFAEDQNGKSVLPSLMDKDDKYVDQPEAGQYAIVKYHFDKKASPGYTYSLVLHTSGYYEPIRSFTGEADLAFLNRFREPAYFSMYSMNRFQTITRVQDLATNQNQ